MCSAQTCLFFFRTNTNSKQYRQRQLVTQSYIITPVDNYFVNPMTVLLLPMGIGQK